MATGEIAAAPIDASGLGLVARGEGKVDSVSVLPWLIRISIAPE